MKMSDVWPKSKAITLVVYGNVTYYEGRKCLSFLKEMKNISLLGNEVQEV